MSRACCLKEENCIRLESRKEGYRGSRHTKGGGSSTRDHDLAVCGCRCCYAVCSNHSVGHKTDDFPPDDIRWPDIFDIPRPAKIQGRARYLPKC